MHASVLLEKDRALPVLCRRYQVERLELFGSAAKTSPDAPPRDLDFLVRFKAGTPEEHARRYFGLLAELQDLFGRPIDLVEDQAVSNPFFLEAIQASRTLVYE